MNLDVIMIRLSDVTACWPSTAGVDVTATNAAFAVALEELLRQRYPHALVAVAGWYATYGSDHISIRCGDPMRERTIRSTIHHIITTLQEDSAWVVMRELLPA